MQKDLFGEVTHGYIIKEVLITASNQQHQQTDIERTCQVHSVSLKFTHAAAQVVWRGGLSGNTDRG